MRKRRKLLQGAKYHVMARANRREMILDVREIEYAVPKNFYGYEIEQRIKLPNLEGAVKERLEQLGIKDMAGITTWTGFFAPNGAWDGKPDEYFYDSYTGMLCNCEGREDIKRLREWAIGYQLKAINL